MVRSDGAGGDAGSRAGRWHPLMVLSLGLAAWVYWPILRVQFFADDLVHLAAIESDPLLVFLLSPFGGHNYLVRNLVFLGTWKLFGFHPGWFYATVLATHLVNVALLFQLVWRATGRPTLACFGAALWGTSPLCVGTLAWYSVFGQVLVATILLLLLARIEACARAGAPLSRGFAWLAYGLLLAGTTCFGIGVGVAVVFPAVVFVLLPEEWRRRGAVLLWLSLPIVTMALYFGFRRLSNVVAPFTMAEMMQEYLATQGGIAAAPAAWGHLLAVAFASGTFGFLLPPDAYPSPATSAAVAVVLAGVAVVLWRGDEASRRVTLAMLVTALGVYGIIAAGRANAYAMFHVPASTAARVGRYHYVGALPVAVIACVLLRELARLPGARAVPGALALAAGLAVIVVGAVRVGVVVPDRAEDARWVARTEASILADVKTVPPGQTAYLANGVTPPYVLGPSLPNYLFPGRAGVFTLFHRRDEVDGRPVRFVNEDADTTSYYAERSDTRLARLLVRPDAVPAGQRPKAP